MSLYHAQDIANFPEHRNRNKACASAREQQHEWPFTCATGPLLECSRNFELRTVKETEIESRN